MLLFHVSDASAEFASFTQSLPSLLEARRLNSCISVATEIDDDFDRPPPIPPRQKSNIRIFANAEFESDDNSRKPTNFLGGTAMFRPPIASLSSPLTSKSSPVDQLIAAINDGDILGIRTVVRSKGEDLRSDYWREAARSAHLLHRAISGLHFHGNEKCVVAAVETLVQLKADINATDRAGCTALHKCLQVCTSKNVSVVVKALLQRGINPNAVNKDGDSALSFECRRWGYFDFLHCRLLIFLLLILRLRPASPNVVALLTQGGAAVNSDLGQGLTVLTVVLQAGVQAACAAGLRHKADSSMRSRDPGLSLEADQLDEEQLSLAGKRLWVRIAECLVKAGECACCHIPSSSLILSLVYLPIIRCDLE